ncbi:hypothetical protein RclHR1_04470015 [Rhizophagus clarus]|uniref:Uncharacterized protein n=1 Tax=Rhizophagus clarus TaxID=94130 RepID=A0A2Z6RHL7_9GLOM|nr:hypothetical protein RclHR1_04470015 [Rhizophagus clarus]
MHTCLKKLAEEGELTLEEIPTVKTIKGWIGRYSANFKKEASEKALVGSMENSQNTLASEVLPDEKHDQTFGIKVKEVLLDEKYDWTFGIKCCQAKNMIKLLELGY